MSGQQRDRGMDSLARSMDEAVDGERIDLHDVSRANEDRRVEVEGQQRVQEDDKQAYTADEEPDAQPS